MLTVLTKTAATAAMLSVAFWLIGCALDFLVTSSGWQMATVWQRLYAAGVGGCLLVGVVEVARNSSDFFRAIWGDKE